MTNLSSSSASVRKSPHGLALARALAAPSALARRHRDNERRSTRLLVVLQYISELYCTNNKLYIRIDRSASDITTYAFLKLEVYL